MDLDFLEVTGEAESEESQFNSLKAFVWQWENINVLVAPQEMDLEKIEVFYPELQSLKIQPDAFILMPYLKNPLEELTDCIGNELWHTFPPQSPLFWEETDALLEIIRTQAKKAKSPKSQKLNDIRIQL